MDLDELLPLVEASPLGKAGASNRGARMVAPAQQRQQQQSGSSGGWQPYLVPPNLSGGLPSDGLPLELLPFIAGAALQQPTSAAAVQQPNGWHCLDPLSLGTLPTTDSPSSTAAASSQQPSASEDGEGQPAKKQRGPRPRLYKKHACQCDDCSADLAPLSFYLQRCG